MHDEILNELEAYLSGEGVSRAFTRHREDCPRCARELEEMEQLSVSLQALRIDAAETLAPPLGFYSKVAQTIETEQRSRVWGMFAPDLDFFRKVAFASLMLLAVLGSYLISRDYGYEAPSQVQATLTEHNSTIPHESPADRQHILVTLAAYEH